MAQVKPLNQIGLNPAPESVQRNQHTIYHSARTQKQSHDYHETHRPATPTRARLTDHLNPNPGVSQANKRARSFPGL